jgi:hypothetical protein
MTARSIRAAGFVIPASGGSAQLSTQRFNMRDEEKSWFPFYRALLAGREEETLDLDEIQRLVAAAKEHGRVADWDAERAALEAAKAKRERRPA